MSAPVFIGGAPRSGTTLLRVMLDSHSSICCGPELRAVPALSSLYTQIKKSSGDVLSCHYGIDESRLSGAFATAIERFLSPQLARSGKARVAEKTPANVLHFSELRNMFPEAPLISIIRDGRDVVSSLLQMDWKDNAGKRLDITVDPVAASMLWLSAIESSQYHAEDSNHYIIFYEQLVQSPEKILTALCEFLGEPFEAKMASFYKNPRIGNGEKESSVTQVATPLYGKSIGRWRRDLSESTASLVEHYLGRKLNELGYDCYVG